MNRISFSLLLLAAWIAVGTAFRLQLNNMPSVEACANWILAGANLALACVFYDDKK